MKIIKALSHGLFGSLLIVLSALTISLLSVSLNVTDRDVVTGWPVKAGVYPKITGEILNLAKQGEGGRPDEGLGVLLDNPAFDAGAIEQAIGGVLTADYWQSKIEGITDPAYAWLEGREPELRFTVTFSDRQAELTNAVAEELTKQLGKLPRCQGGLDSGLVDPLKSGCMPAGVTPAQTAKTLSRSLFDNEVFSELEFSSRDLELDPEFERSAPDLYGLLRSLVWLAPAVLGGLVLLVVITGKSRLYGLKRAGQILFGSGVTSWIGFFVVKRLFENFSLPGSGGSGPGAAISSQIFTPLLRVVFQDILTTGLWVAIGVIIVGGLLWLTGFIWHKVHHQSEGRPQPGKSAPQDATLPRPIEPDSKFKDTV